MKKLLRTLFILVFTIGAVVPTIVNPQELLTLQACTTIAECNAESEAIQKDKDAKQAELNEYAATNESYAEQLNIIREQILAIETEITTTETIIELRIKEIEQKEADIKQNEDEVLDRMKDQQQQQNENVYFKLLMSTTNLTDLMKRWDLITKLNDDASRVVEELTTKVKELDAERVTLEEEKASLEVNKTELKDKQTETNNLKKEIKKKMDEAQSTIDDYELSQAEIDEQKEILSRPKPNPSPGGGGNNGGGGYWSAPTYVNQAMLTTHFNSPTYYQMFGWTHAGTDIASYGGAQIAIFAIASGTVIRSTYDGTFGNHVVIYHEKENAISVYAHMSQTYVSAGEYVNGGTQIGNMGNTGLSFGTHLHLEIIYGISYFTYDKGVRMSNGVDLTDVIGTVYPESWDAW